LSQLLSLASTGDFFSLKAIDVIGLDRQFSWPQAIAVIGLDWRFPWPQAHCCIWPSPEISFASSPSLSLAWTGDFLCLKPIAVFGLDGRFPWLKLITVINLTT
jgi:hypothetical protein